MLCAGAADVCTCRSSCSYSGLSRAYIPLCCVESPSSAASSDEAALCCCTSCSAACICCCICSTVCCRECWLAALSLSCCLMLVSILASRVMIDEYDVNDSSPAPPSASDTRCVPAAADNEPTVEVDELAEDGKDGTAVDGALTEGEDEPLIAKLVAGLPTYVDAALAAGCASG